MGRKKVIDREKTMQAIETVVRQHGLAGLTIDAVAKEAGISKSSVLYDFSSKNALLAAFLRSRMETKRAAIADACAQGGWSEDAWLKGLLDHIQTAPSEEDMAIAMIVAAGTGSSDECRKIFTETVSEDMAKVAGQSARPRAAMLAYLAAYGLMSMEYFGFHSFPPAQRDQILQDIGWLMTASPSDTTHPTS